MNPASKEREQVGSSLDEIALKEVDSYIERVEKQAEVKSPLQSSPAQTPPPDPVVDDMGKIVMASFGSTNKPNIVLPFTQEELREGLQHKIVDAVRWASEMCKYLIIKYPGRVFFKPQS